jgi:hypothetical protein
VSLPAGRRFFEDEGFEFLTLVALGAAPYRLSEVGEVLATVGEVKDGDMQSWFDAWMGSGERAERIAKEAERSGRRQTARDAHLRASMYVGTAFFNVLGTSSAKDKVGVWRRHRANAEKAFELWPTPVEKVAIPYEGTTLEGFFFSGGEGELPLYVLNNGSDGTVVEMLTFGMADAPLRGYHALTFDGPGQGQALYEQELYFRYDWERVITPVVDWAAARDDVDRERIALFGCSQAGYWVPRAAAFEHRLAAAIADPGVVEVGTSWTRHLPKELLDLVDAGDRKEFDAAMEGVKVPPAVQAVGEKRMEPYGTDSFFDILTELKRWDLTDVAAKVECPLLITDPEGEQFWPGQSNRLYDLITAPRTLMKFTAAEGANWHCEPMAPVLRTHRVLDWLDANI